MQAIPLRAKSMQAGRPGREHETMQAAELLALLRDKDWLSIFTVEQAEDGADGFPVCKLRISRDTYWAVADLRVCRHGTRFGGGIYLANSSSKYVKLSEDLAPGDKYSF